MKKEIKVYIKDSEELLEKYNDNKISKDIIEYIISEAMLLNKEDNIDIIINKDKSVFSVECTDLKIEGLKDEYKRSLKVQHDNNMKQIYFFILGMILLFLSTQLKADSVWREIIVISGWVPIWEMVKIELFPDVQGRIKRKIINKLLKSNIIEKED